MSCLFSILDCMCQDIECEKSCVPSAFIVQCTTHLILRNLSGFFFGKKESEGLLLTHDSSVHLRGNFGSSRMTQTIGTPCCGWRGYSYLPSKINLCENGALGVTADVNRSGVELGGIWDSGGVVMILTGYRGPLPERPCRQHPVWPTLRFVRPQCLASELRVMTWRLVLL